MRLGLVEAHALIPVGRASYRCRVRCVAPPVHKESWLSLIHHVAKIRIFIWLAQCLMASGSRSPSRLQRWAGGRVRRHTSPRTREPRVSDADHFKQINDGMGHAAGDTVLAAFGARLTAGVGPRVAVGRLGGDEPLTELTRTFSQVRRPFC
ncbi:diguanylate cyclase [Streptomyces yangpuensis]|uniref:diguanylate cyclase n=1 Tax=Streptomyces yangpuensis TaxID=1648182 RepID=UPI003816FB7B